MQRLPIRLRNRDGCDRHFPGIVIVLSTVYFCYIFYITVFMDDAAKIPHWGILFQSKCASGPRDVWHFPLALSSKNWIASPQLTVQLDPQS